MASVMLSASAVPGPRNARPSGGSGAAAGGGPVRASVGGAIEAGLSGDEPVSEPAAHAVPPAAPAPPPVPPTVLFAGPGHRELVADLLGDALPDESACAYLVLRHGAPAGRAYIPGHREPRDLDPRGTEPAGPMTRPARRVALSRPANLLRYVHLVLAPDLGPSAAGTYVLADVLRHSDGLVYALDAGEPLAPDQRDELEFLAARAARLILVDVRDATDSERAAIVRRLPTLAGARWHRLADLTALRTELTAASAWLAGPAAGDGAVNGSAVNGSAAAEPLPAAPGAVRVTDDDLAWRAALHDALAALRDSTRHRVRAELAALESRCGSDPAALPTALDAELHALSIRVTDALDEAANELIATVFAEVVLDRLNEPVRARVVTAVRRQLEPDDRTLLVTATAGVAAVSGATDAASATGAAAHTIVAPVSVAVSGNCHLMWLYRGVPDKADGRRWLHHAVRALECELDKAVAERFAGLAEAVETLAAEAVDHGVLLA
jgi:hypothetical protein